MAFGVAATVHDLDLRYAGTERHLYLVRIILVLGDLEGLRKAPGGRKSMRARKALGDKLTYIANLTNPCGYDEVCVVKA